MTKLKALTVNRLTGPRTNMMETSPGSPKQSQVHSISPFPWELSYVYLTVYTSLGSIYNINVI